MNTTSPTQTPVSATITKVAELLTRQDIPFFAMTNQWGGLDLWRSANVNHSKDGVRLTNDDGQTNMYVLRNLGPNGIAATFTNMPAGVIVAAVAAYLA